MQKKYFATQRCNKRSLCCKEGPGPWTLDHRYTTHRRKIKCLPGMVQYRDNMHSTRHFRLHSSKASQGARKQNRRGKYKATIYGRARQRSAPGNGGHQGALKQGRRGNTTRACPRAGRTYPATETGATESKAPVTAVRYRRCRWVYGAASCVFGPRHLFLLGFLNPYMRSNLVYEALSY
jgi:hypothetical protein